MEGSFIRLGFVLFEILAEMDSASVVEFHCFFYTLKGRKLQKRLSRNNYKGLKSFLEDNVFDPVGLHIIEYFTVERDYKIKGKEMLFSSSLPGVIIEIGGELEL